MRYAAATGISFCFLSLPTTSWAYRPFDSTDADVAKRGELEFEIGPVGYLRENGDRFLVVPAVIANAGVLDRWEVVLEGRNRIRLARAPDEARLVLGDAAFSIKGILREGSLQDQSGLSVATEIGSLLPATEEGTGFGGSAALILSERGPLMTAHVNGGGFVSRNHHAGAFGGLILEGPFAWTVRPVAEGFIERELDVGTVATGLVGAIWPARDNLSFDAAVRAGRASDMSLIEVRAGLTWAFPL